MELPPSLKGDIMRKKTPSTFQAVLDLLAVCRTNCLGRGSVEVHEDDDGHTFKYVWVVNNQGDILDCALMAPEDIKLLMFLLED